MLGVLLHAPRGPFYSPKAARNVESNPGRQFLPSIGRRTGQSGVPPDRHCSASGADCFPKLAQPTVEDLEPLAHRTQFGAHRTVRCPIRPLAWPCVTRGLRGRPLARPNFGSPDSPVNFSRTPPTNSREWPVDQTTASRTGHCPLHHRIVWCTQTAQSLGSSSQVFFLLCFL
jgi:hypothetical protein